MTPAHRRATFALGSAVMTVLAALLLFSGSVGMAGCGGSDSTGLCGENEVLREGNCCLPDETTILENSTFHPDGECCEPNEVVELSGSECCDKDGDGCCTTTDGVTVCEGELR